MKSLATLILSACLSLNSWATDSSRGVILLYHHVANDTPKSTSISPEKFRQHLEFLKSQNAHVVPLSELLTHTSQGKALDDKTLAISFDDAYLSIYENARALLKEFNYPYSVFVANEAIDLNLPAYLSWQQLQTLVSEGVEIGGHSVTHAHLTQIPLAQAQIEISDNIARLEEKLGIKVRSFAYPYGEYNAQIEAMVTSKGLFGVTQHSGAVGENTPKGEVPRYIFASNFDTIDRLKTVLLSRPLPVVTETKADSQLTFTLAPGETAYREQQLACFLSSGKPLTITREEKTVRIDLPKPRIGRNKINCTAPAKTGTGVYYWYSFFWLNEATHSH